MHLALKSSWLFQSSCGESGGSEAQSNLHELSVQLNQDIEMAIVNSKAVPPGSAAYSPSLEVSVPDLFERRKAVNRLYQTTTRNTLTRRSVVMPEKSEESPSELTEGIRVVSEAGAEISEAGAETRAEPGLQTPPTAGEDGEMTPAAVAPRSAAQKQRVAKGFVQKVGQTTVTGSRVKLPSVYSKLGSALQYSSFRGHFH